MACFSSLEILKLDSRVYKYVHSDQVVQAAYISFPFPFASKQLPQLTSVIITIRKPLYRVNVILSRLFVSQKHSRVVIKLKQSHRALDPIVKRVCCTESPDPREVSLRQVLLNLLKSELQWLWRQKYQESSDG